MPKYEMNEQHAHRWFVVAIIVLVTAYLGYIALLIL